MRLDHDDGFSALELLVATVVALVFSIAGWSFQRTQAVELHDQSASLDATERIRAAMGFMAREIRRAGYDPRLTALIVPGTKGISVARSDRILVEFDANQNGAIDADADDPGAESVLYSYDSANRRIVRTAGGAAETLITGVPPGGFTLEYFDLLGNPLPLVGLPPALDFVQRDLIALVRINLRVEAVASSRPETLGLASRVTVRQRILDKL
ncbi:MAG: PilW family protein [Candidatus Binatia bacterium]